MAENVTYKDASNVTQVILTDEVARNSVTGHVQLVKLVDPTDNSSAAWGNAANAARVDPTGATTQPVSATSLPLPSGAAADATLTAGTVKVINRGGAKGSTTAADVTSQNVDANTQAIHAHITGQTAAFNVRGGGAADYLAIRLTDGSAYYTAAGAKGATIAVTTVTVTTTATLLIASNANRKTALFTPQGAASVFLGPAGVTAATGQDLTNSKPFEDAMSTGAWYGIVASGTADVRVLELT